jgi:hypothetical protein
MAKTYYKYVERGTESQINWGEVGRSVSEMIATEAAVREQKKAAIDESSRQFGEVLANAPTGAFTTANEWTLEYANDAAQALLLLDRQLKTGQISLKDYTIKRQNLNDSTNEMFNLSKMYQDKYAEALQRSQTDASSKAEMEFINQVEGLSNFKDSKAYINPADYTVSVGKMIQTKGADGETVMMLDPNPNNYKRVNQLKNYMELKIDKYNYTEAIDSKVASLGKNETTIVKKLNGIYRTYGITNISDPTQRAKFGVQLTDEELKSMTAYELWEKNTIAAQFANPYVLQSVLMDAVATDPKTGEPYEMTTNAEEAKSSSKYIYFEDDGSGRPVPKPTKEQEQVAEGFMRTMIRNSIDQVSKTDTQAMPSTEYAPEYILNRGDAQKESLTNAGYWNQLWWGDSRQKTAAAEALLGTTIAQQQGLLAIDASQAGKITLKYADGKKNRTINLRDFTPAEWAATGVELHGENDRNRAMNAGGGFGGKTVNLNAATEAKRAGTATSPSGGKQTVQEKAVNYLNSSLKTSSINKTESESVPEINRVIQPLGFSGEESGMGSYITITAPDGKTTKTFSLNDGSDSASKVKEDIITWMEGLMDTEKLAAADASGRLGKGTGSGDALFK